jgi:mRNA interferase RelE/StbE
VRIVWRRDALVSARRFMSDQPGIRAVNQAVATLADNPEPPDAFVRGSYRRLRVGAYRVLYEVENDLVTIVRVDRAL